MPRVCRAETAKNRNAIRRASSRLFREQGLRASVTDVMSAAGLTHGGFYGHFGSKDELAAEACSAAFAESVARWRKRIGTAADPAAARAALIEGYLALQNRAAIGTGCPLAALATDVAREPPGKPVRSAFHAGLERLIEMLTEVEPRPAGAARSRALTELSTLVGAMVLARATDATALSDELLQSAARSLLGAGTESPQRRPRGRRRRHAG